MPACTIAAAADIPVSYMLPAPWGARSSILSQGHISTPAATTLTASTSEHALQCCFVMHHTSCLSRKQ